MTLAAPPNEAVIRAAVISLISTDTDVLAWFAGTNPASEAFTMDIGEYNIFEIPSDELSTRVQILSVNPMRADDPFAICTEFMVRMTVWVFFHSLGSSLAHHLIGTIEEAIQGKDIYTQTFQAKTVAIRDVIFTGRVAQIPMARSWAIPSSFRFSCEYA